MFFTLNFAIKIELLFYFVKKKKIKIIVFFSKIDFTNLMYNSIEMISDLNSIDIFLDVGK